MKKIFLIVLSTAFIISCSDDAPVTNVADESSVEQIQDYDDIFAKYSTFLIDGQVTSDKTKIKESLQNSEVINYSPKKKIVYFFSTRDKFKELTNAPLDQLSNDDELDEGTVDGFGKILDKDGYLPNKPMSGDDISKNSDLAGINGLGTLVNQTLYTNFAKRVYFISDYDYGTTYFSAVSSNHASIWNGGNLMTTVRMTSSNVRGSNLAIGYSFRNLYSYNSLDLSVKNDDDETMYLVLFENSNFGGRMTVVTLSVDEVHDFGRYDFSHYSADRPRSIKLWNYDDYNEYQQDGIMP